MSLGEIWQVEESVSDAKQGSKSPLNYLQPFDVARASTSQKASD